MKMKNPSEISTFADMIEQMRSQRNRRDQDVALFAAEIDWWRASIASGAKAPAAQESLKPVESHVRFWIDHRQCKEDRLGAARRLATLSMSAPEVFDFACRELERQLPSAAEPVGHRLYEKFLAAEEGARSKELPDLIGSRKSRMHALLGRHHVLGTVRENDYVHGPILEFARKARCASTWINIHGLYSADYRLALHKPLCWQQNWPSYPRYVAAALDRAMAQDQYWAEIEDQTADERLISLIEMREGLKPIDPAGPAQRDYARKVRAVAVLIGIERSMFSRLTAASSILDRLAPLVSQARRQRTPEPPFPGGEIANRTKPSDDPPRVRRSFLRPAPQIQV